ncbi:MAG: uroporphyrinogen decarboxylase [Chlamydiales bacterium]|nr:uroporphyrinogen decarboxylase [Chlamydiales bacterium]
MSDSSSMIFTDALHGNNQQKRPPVWLMRQAGRYMHEYQSLRKKHDFLSLCHNPELICQVTHLPIDAFGFDAAILFSDILLILEPLGFDLRFYDDVGPVIANPLEIGGILQRRSVVSKLDFALQGIKLLKNSLKVPLLGFAGAPFTVASYAIEGKSSRDMRKTKKWLLEDPDSFDKVLDVIADCTIEYLNAQLDAGCEAVQIFDSWAMHLAGPQFERFVKNPLEKITKGLKKAPILFCRGTSAFTKKLADINPQALSFDWTCNLKDIRAHTNICLQGNLDPDILLTNPQTVVREARALLDTMKHDPAFIFNLGHGIHKDTPRENVQALVDCVKSYA